MLARSLLFFSKQQARTAHGSPIHLILQEKLGEQLEEYRNINRHLRRVEYLGSQYTIFKELGENSLLSLPKPEEITSFENELNLHKEKITKNMMNTLDGIRKECAYTEEPEDTHYECRISSSRIK